MLRRRDDPRYVKSAIATVAFYAAVLAACAAAGFFLRGWALAGLAALVLWLYRGPLFGAARWPAPLDVDEMIRAERARNLRADSSVDYSAGEARRP